MSYPAKVGLTALVIIALSAAKTIAAGPAPPEEIWEGTLKIQPGLELRLVVHIQKGEGKSLTAALDSPDQGASNLKIDVVTRDKSRLAFEMKALAAKFEGKLNDAGTEAVGTWTQGGGSLPLTLSKKDRVTPEPKLVGKEQFWEGKLPIGAGLSYRLILRIDKTEEGKLLASLDSPDEGLKKLKVDPITIDREKLAFELKISAATYEGKLNADGTEAIGEWSQRGVKLPLTFKKTDQPTAVLRPQTPKPPFPYEAEKVRYPGGDPDVTLAGTLTRPKGKGPFPAVLLISGSGAQDRDETLFQHKPFLVLADALTRRGLAVLRVDDRGVGGSTGSMSKATSKDFADDVLAGIAFLKARPDVDATKIGLIGHSEGGLIAPLVASRSNAVAFIVLLAGTGLPGDEIILMQARLLSKALGGGGADLEHKMSVQKRLLDIAKTEPDDEKSLAQMRDVVKELIEASSKPGQKTDAELARLSAQLKAMRSPWYRHFLAYDPRQALARVHCPVLALCGEKDLQVPPKENLAAIESALKQAGNTRVTIKELPSLNHLFQTCRTGSTAEYAQIEETFAPSALAVIGDWIAERIK